MKRFAIATLTILCCVAISGVAMAGMRSHDYEHVSFGDTFHKDPAGINLNYMKIRWDKNGVTELRFEFSVWKGKPVWNDTYIVGKKDGKEVILYKLSSKKKLDKEFCFTECLHKKVDENHFFTTPIGPFDIESGQVWWVISYGADKAHVIWDIKSNRISWYKASQRKAPPMAK